MKMYHFFETERLWLRPTMTEDARFILELFNSPKWLKFIGDRNVRTEEAALEYIKNRMIAQLQRLGFANYTVIRKSDGEKIGTCGLYDRPNLEGIDLGFAFLPAYEGQGYAFEAAEMLKKAAETVFQIEQLQAIALPENTRSLRLLEKLGFQFQGKINLPDDPEELYFYKNVKD